MLILRQSTSIDIRLGPFMDATDGLTPETGVTIAAADEAEVLKANGAATVAMTGTLAAVTNCDGWYDYTVQTGDVDTVGEVVFVMQKAVDPNAYIPVYVRGFVVEETIFDAFFAASAAGEIAVKLSTQGKADVNAEADTAISDASLATAANLATVDTVVDAIKVVTDKFTFTVPNVVDANVTYVNEIAVAGSGTSADPWGP